MRCVELVRSNFAVKYLSIINNVSEFLIGTPQTYNNNIKPLVIFYSRKDELVQALQEISVEDRKRRLANSKSDLAAAEKRIKQINKEMEEVERKVQAAVKNEKALKIELDKWRNKVRFIIIVIHSPTFFTQQLLGL